MICIDQCKNSGNIIVRICIIKAHVRNDIPEEIRNVRLSKCILFHRYHNTLHRKTLRIHINIFRIPDKIADLHAGCTNLKSTKKTFYDSQCLCLFQCPFQCDFQCVVIVYIGNNASLSIFIFVLKWNDISKLCHLI